MSALELSECIQLTAIFLILFNFLCLRQHLPPLPPPWPFPRPSSSCISLSSPLASLGLFLFALSSSPPATTSVCSSSLVAVRSGVPSLVSMSKECNSYTLRISIPADVGLEATSPSSNTTTSPCCRGGGRGGGGGGGDGGGETTEEAKEGGRYTKSSFGGRGQTPVNWSGVTRGPFSLAQETNFGII